MRLRLFAAVAVAAGVLGSVPVLAQSTATLQGTITDAQNAVMPGVSITLHNTATNQERIVVSDAAGAYVLAALAPGHYDLTLHGPNGFYRHYAGSPALTLAVSIAAHGSPCAVTSPGRVE